MSSIASVFDVARYILERTGPITHMKLQKLVYYSQAWGLVWDDEPLFPERIEAWINGPVCPDLYSGLKGFFNVHPSDVSGKVDQLTLSQRETIDSVVNYYGKFNSQYLSDLTHLEEPWRQARSGLPDSCRGSTEISHASMCNYYSGIEDSSGGQ